jgi:thiol-disulfide isomerase/thioredoxin
MKEKAQEKQSSKKDKNFEKSSQNVDFQNQSNAQRSGDQSGRMSSKDSQEWSTSSEGRSTIGQKQEKHDEQTQGHSRNFSQEQQERESMKTRGKENEGKGMRGSWEKENRLDTSETNKSEGMRSQQGSWEKENRMDPSTSGRMDSNFNMKQQSGKEFSDQSFQSDPNWNQGQMSSDARKMRENQSGSSNARNMEREANETKNKMSTESERGEMTWATGGKMKSTESKRTDEMNKQNKKEESDRTDQKFPGMQRDTLRMEDEGGKMPSATSGQQRGMESSQRFFEGTQRTENPERNQSSEKRDETMRQERRGQENQAFGKQESQGLGRREAQGKQSEHQGREETQEGAPKWTDLAEDSDKINRAMRGGSEGEKGKEMSGKKESEMPESSSSEMLIVSSNVDWEGLKQDSKPVILDFFKEGCGVCKRLYPKLTEKAKSSKGKWVLAGADIEKDKIKPLARDLNVDAAPTVMLFFKGKLVEKFSGQNENEMNRLFEKAEELSSK